MLLENKTNHFHSIELKDGNRVTVRPYRTVEVPSGTQYNNDVFALVSESKPKPLKGDN